MEDLAKFFADIIEFIVGGVFFLASLLLLATALAPDAMETFFGHAKDAPDGFNGIYTIAGIAVVYAMGIVAEGVSRVIFERRLDTLTRDKFYDDEDLPASRQSSGPRSTPDPRALPAFPRLRTRLRKIRKRFERPDRDLVDRCVDLRETWRVEAVDHGLVVPIDYQLKRLRIERTLALSGAMASLGLFPSHVGLALLLVGFTVLAIYLVNERFERFLGAIRRCHAQVQERITEREHLAELGRLAEEGEPA